LHTLALGNVELTDGWGNKVEGVSLQNGLVDVAGPAIPAPATALLLLPALLMLARRRA